MEEKPTVSDICLDKIISTQYEIPQSVEVALKKVEVAELDRAKRDVADRLQVILTSVNQALYRMRLSSTLEEEQEAEEELSTLHLKEEKKRRGQQLLAIRDFQHSSLDKERHLGGVLQWLRDLNHELLEVEEDEEFKEVQNITEEWVEEMQKKIESSMFDIQACVIRLHQLCSFLFDLDTSKKKKGEGAINKGGVWRWWRESKVDARTILKIQELQPPSVERLLADPNLGTKSATYLGFMLGDIAKSLSCNKAMSTAFRFVQMGLHNLNEALLERTHETNWFQAQLEDLKSANAQTHLARAQTELDATRRRVVMLEAENRSLKEENCSQQAQIHQLHQDCQASTAIEVVEQLMEFPINVPLPPPALPPTNPKRPRRPPPPKKQPKEAPLVAESKSPKTPSQVSAKPEPVLPDYFEGVTYEEEFPSLPKSVSVQEVRPEPELFPVDMLEEMEKRSTNLLSDFQSSVFNIIEKSLPVKPGAAGGGTAGQLQSMGLDKDKVSEAIKLYIVLQKTIKNSFNQLTTKLHGTFTDSVLEMPFVVNELGHSGFWDDTSKSPVEILKEINQTFVKHDQGIQSVDSNIHVLMRNTKAMLASSETSQKDRDQLPEPLLEVISQMININNISKLQACKMRLALEGLLDIKRQICRKPEKIIHVELEQPDCVASTPSLDSLGKDIPEEKLPHHRQPEKPSRVERCVLRSSALAASSRRFLKTRVRELAAPREDMQRYWAEMEEESVRIEKTVMAGAAYRVGVASQKNNMHLLRQAAIDRDISSELYSFSKKLITRAYSLDQARLACLLQKFMAFRSLQQVRYNLNMQLLAARELQDGQTVRDMYCFLTRLDLYQYHMLARWKKRQAEIDQARRTCLARMIYLFNEISQDCNLHLVPPLRCSTEVQPHFLSIEAQTRRTGTAFTPLRRHRPRYPGTPSFHQSMTGSEIGPLSGVRELLRGQLPALWCSDLTLNSQQLARKQPASPASFPFIPQLLELDVNHGRHIALRSALGMVTEGQQLLARGDI